jgi:kynurenine formamidase
MNERLIEMGDALPSYKDLLTRNDAPSGSSWDLFGVGDEVGTLNLLTRERVRHAAGLVRTGKSFNLDYPINAFVPPTEAKRHLATHSIFEIGEEYVRDDYLDGLYMQATSQIDGLRHVGHKSLGFYGGIKGNEIKVGSEVLGIQRWAERGIVGRGVLLDVERYLAAKGTPLNHTTGEAFTVDLLDRVARSANITFENGDILVLHTGWCRFYFEELGEESRASIPRNPKRCCGLAQSVEMLEWLWDHHFSAVVSDTIALEARPTVPDSPFQGSVMGMMHQDLIALLGICIGELWRLDELAADCAADGVYECMVVAKPLNIVGGVGSPPNALALK